MDRGAMEFVSSIEQNVWPAVPTGTAAQLLALQYQFDASQWWPEGQLRACQIAQLQRLLQHAAATVPFHAERLRDAGIDPRQPLTEQSWARLPILTRRDVQQQGERLYASQVPPEHGALDFSSTGGSTGVPVLVRKTALDRMMFNAGCIRDELWNRDDMRGTVARLRPLPRGLTAEQTRLARSPEGLILPNWGPPQSLLWQTGPVGIVDISSPIRDQVQFLQQLQPNYLLTYPANLRLLLAHCRDHGVTVPSLRSVWTMSEVLDPALRELCQHVFGLDIVHNYTATEVGYLALQCPEQPHLHVQSELLRLEVLNEDGRACAPGETGRVVVTPLHNYAMPLLRYEIGDEAEVGAPCPCGRGLPVLTRIVGRSVDHITLPSGQRVHSYIDHMRLSRIAAIREFQLVQRSLERIEVLMVVSRPLTQPEQQEVLALIAAQFSEQLRIELTFHDSIPRTASGKLRPFISELPA
jgi:phenylacetate-CoA ligase